MTAVPKLSGVNSAVSARHWLPRQTRKLIVAMAVGATASILLSACSNWIATVEPFSESDLVGTWQAVYASSVPFVTIPSTETLTLKADGTYTQVFARGTAGIVDVVDGKRWYLDDTEIVHLVEGMWPQLGPYSSRLFAQREVHGFYPIRGKQLPLDAGEAYLLVSSIGNGRFNMYHVPTGDPDSPTVIWFEPIQNNVR